MENKTSKNLLSHRHVVLSKNQEDGSVADELIKPLGTTQTKKTLALDLSGLTNDKEEGARVSTEELRTRADGESSDELE